MNQESITEFMSQVPVRKLIFKYENSLNHGLNVPNSKAYRKQWQASQQAIFLSVVAKSFYFELTIGIAMDLLIFFQFLSKNFIKSIIMEDRLTNIIIYLVVG